MKISSRSLLSPGRAAARDQPPISLPTSLSRRLRNSRSIKGGASPAMFTATGKKRGAFENPEPSSPKVTCIGQVKVKSKKKHAKNGRSLSRRRTPGEVSFRKLEHSLSQTQYQLQNQECLQRNNERWVHLPLTIYEALRTFGSEFSCLFPCRSSCSSTTMEKEEKMVEERGIRQGSCGAVFVRWLVALQEGDGGGRDACAGDRRETELVAGDENEEMDVRNSRRHVFQDLEIVNDVIMGNKDEARVSICVPPKNALLLMRCRSDPVKMEALTNRFWEPNVEKYEEEYEEFVDDEGHIPQKEENLMAFVEANDQEHNDLHKDAFDQEKVKNNIEMEMIHSIETSEEEEESMFLCSLFEESTDQDLEEEPHSEMVDVQEELFDDVQEELFEDVQETQTWGKKPEEMVTEFTERSETLIETHEEDVMESKKLEFGVIDRKDEEKERLPECLLLMMYEPKLSMELSKETWVCSTDFIRHRRNKPPQPPPPPPAAVKSIEGQDESKVNGNQVKRVLHQPARSSCSFPAPSSMGTGYEPLVLTRCKSEPMRTPSAKLAPESCFWKNKLEPPRRASFGMDMAGLGLGF